MKQDFRTPLARTRGLGAARSGTSHFIYQRALSVFILLAFVYCSASVLLFGGLSLHTMRAWFHNPFNAAICAIMVLASCWHFTFGVQVAIEDYIHKISTKFALEMSAKIFASLIGLTAILIILKLYVSA